MAAHRGPVPYAIRQGGIITQWVGTARERPALGRGCLDFAHGTHHFGSGSAMTIPTNSYESAPMAPNNSSLEDEGSHIHAPEQLPVKVCPRCSVQSQTAGSFCPNCAAPFNGPGSRSRISKRMVLVVVAAIVVIASATGLALKVSHDNQVTTQLVAAAQAQRRSADAAKAQADAAAAAEAVKKAADDQTRTDRKAMVTQLEASILKDAKDRVNAQTLTGPIFSASCTPLGGGSADDLTALTGTFECIAVNQKNADGTSSGYRFSATINWNKDYTWHLGS